MRPCCSSSVGGFSFPVGPFAGSLFSNGFVQLVSISGGATVVSRPPMKNSASDPATAHPALLSALWNMLRLLLAADAQCRRQNVVREHADAGEDQRTGEESNQP